MVLSPSTRTPAAVRPTVHQRWPQVLKRANSRISTRYSAFWVALSTSLLDHEKRATYKTTIAASGDTAAVGYLGNTRPWSLPAVHSHCRSSTRERVSRADSDRSRADLARRQLAVYLYWPDILEHRHREFVDRLADRIIHQPVPHPRVRGATCLISSETGIFLGTYWAVPIRLKSMPE
jgi:hypothetical protein